MMCPTVSAAIGRPAQFPGESRRGVASETTGWSTELAASGSSNGPRDTSLTFLFTDVESSTRLWEENPRVMRLALEQHDAILRSAIANSHGEIVKTTGDGLMAVFTAPDDAVAAAVAAQRDLTSQAWPDRNVIRVRMGIHTGEVEARGGDYFGPAVNRTARIMSAGHGGRTLPGRGRAALGQVLALCA